MIASSSTLKRELEVIRRVTRRPLYEKECWCRLRFVEMTQNLDLDEERVVMG